MKFSNKNENVQELNQEREAEKNRGKQERSKEGEGGEKEKGRKRKKLKQSKGMGKKCHYVMHLSFLMLVPYMTECPYMCCSVCCFYLVVSLMMFSFQTLRIISYLFNFASDFSVFLMHLFLYQSPQLIISCLLNLKTWRLQNKIF